MHDKSSVLDVSIIIPFKDKSELTLACFHSLLKFGNPVKEILLVSNNSSDVELEKIRDAAREVKNARVLVYDEPFNFQAINNWAATQGSHTKYIMMLNNDIELTVQSHDLLKAMCEKAGEPNAGAVGSVLLYGNRKTIQHAGIYLVPGATADHLYIGKNYQKTLERIATNPASPDITKDMQVAGVTAAALVMKRDRFDSLGGMNEAFIIGGGDVDLCLRASEKGYNNWLIGSKSGYMIHKESISRSHLGIPYVDFVESYKSYIKHFDVEKGDLFLNWEVVQNEK